MELEDYLLGVTSLPNDLVGMLLVIIYAGFNVMRSHDFARISSRRAM